MRKKKAAKPPKAKAAKPKNPIQPESDHDMEDGTVKPTVWLPGYNTLEDGETLQYDPTAYDCMSSMSMEWPCLSFDIIPDSLGDDRRTFPHTLFMVAGTQASQTKLNYLAVAKVSNLAPSQQHTRSRKKEDANNDSDNSDDDMLSSDSEDETEDAKLHVRRIAHTGGINRVRAMHQQPHIVASWADTAQVQIWDLSSQLSELANETEPTSGATKLLKINARQVHSHSAEGFALDWSRTTQGLLASGDTRAKIHIWHPSPAGKWVVSGAIKGHEASVEDLQWSPTEATVFASASVDKTVRIWDTRDTTKPMITALAHDTDVNVISWNSLTTYMLASGADDGSLKVWDLRQFSPGNNQPSPVANFTYHKKPITSVEWCPHEASMLLTTSSDDTLGVWDLALERDPEEEAALAPEGNVAAPDGLPPQLLFVHAGQSDTKEAHWHRQIPGMMISTAGDGFNLFKPSNV